MLDKRNELIRKKRQKRFLVQAEKKRARGKLERLVSLAKKASNDEIWASKANADLLTRSSAVVKVPETFSFIEDPEAAIDALDKLHAALVDRKIHDIYIDFSTWKILDLCASTVMTAIVLRARSRRKRKKAALHGNYPATERAKILLRSSGLLNYVKTTAPILPLAIRSKLFVMDLRSGFSAKPERSHKCDQATTSLLDYIQKCLSLSGAKLTPHGLSTLGTMVAETISNAEEHSVGTWYATAHFDRLEPDTQEGGACHVVLMNFGPTIYDSFFRDDSDPLRLAKLQQLANHHKRRNSFDVRPRRYDEETLYTLYAVQEGVSRSSDRRGLGTTYLIDFFMKLSSPGAKMCLTSGSAFLLFDGTFPAQWDPKLGIHVT